MRDAYDDHRTLTTTGTHRGGAPAHDTGATVRAEEAPDPEAGDAAPADPPPFQVVERTDAAADAAPDDDAGRYRIRPRPDAPPADAFAELGRYASEAAVRTALLDAGVPADDHHLVVERTDGEAVFTPDRRLAAGGFGDPGVRRVTVFLDAASAAAYADRVRR
jgi:hypothetical protein